MSNVLDLLIPLHDLVRGRNKTWGKRPLKSSSQSLHSIYLIKASPFLISGFSLFTSTSWYYLATSNMVSRLATEKKLVPASATQFPGSFASEFRREHREHCEARSWRSIVLYFTYGWEDISIWKSAVNPHSAHSQERD